MSPSEPATPFDAATVLLVRDGGAGLEVFMQVRSAEVDFVAGAMVFPGGRVDADDADSALHARCAGAEALDARALAFRVAAIREVFEECGVLLARPRGARDLVSATRADELVARYSEALAAERLRLLELVEREDLELACNGLVPFAHWITPERMPKRFDTHFFLAEAPPQRATTLGAGESVHSEWVRPADALRAAADGQRAIIFPTRMNLAKLSKRATVRDALAAARREPVVTVLPELRSGPAGPVLHIPADAGYDRSEIPLDEELARAGPRHPAQ